jgi:hypothetical protein
VLWICGLIIANLKFNHKTVFWVNWYHPRCLSEIAFYAKITGDPIGILPERGGRMSQTAPNPKPPSRLKRLLLGMTDDSKPRLPRRPGTASSPAENESSFRSRFLPAFWTVASVLSLIVNLVLIGILLIVLQMLGTIRLTANDQFSSALGGLYTNFVKMDQAVISTNVPVQATIPLNITVPVQTQDAQIKLSRDVPIPRAHVKITEGGVQIDAFAEVILPKDTLLWIDIAPAFNLPVQADIPIQLNIPVNIPLNQTQLHDPYTGLQGVVKPYYCLLEPNATWNSVQISSPLANPTTP